MEIHRLVREFNAHNQDLELHRKGPSVDRRSRIVEEQLNDVVETSPEQALQILIPLVELVQHDGSDSDALTFLGAGALEELLKLHGREVIDRIEHLAADSPRWRFALLHVRGVDPVIAIRLRALGERDSNGVG